MFRGLSWLLIFGCLTGLAAAQSSKSVLDPENPVSPQARSSVKEDWAKLPVDRKALPLLAAGVVLGKSEEETYTSELIRLQWRPADPIDVWVVKPRAVQKPRVAIYLYSYPSSVDRFRDDSWCKAATSNGLAAVGFVSALTGDRFRGRPMREWFVRELQESMGASAHDVQLMIDYLARRGDLNVDKVGMFGQGSGAAIAVLAAEADPRIQALDLLNPWGDWPDWLKDSPVVPENERSEFLAPGFLEKSAVVEPVTYLPSLKDRSLRVQQVMDYPNTPASARDKIGAAVPAGDLVRYKDRKEHAQAWTEDGLSGWLAKQLAVRPASAAAASLH